MRSPEKLPKRHFIKHVIEFNDLMLVWQSPQDEQRIRYVVGKLVRNKSDVTLFYLTESSDFKKALKLGFDGYPAFMINKEIHAMGVLDAFMRRLPPRTRSDFEQYLEILRLPPNVNITDFSLLGYSGAKLPSDTFSIVPSFESTGPCEFLMDVAGFRHISEIVLDHIELGTEVYFEEEPENKIDSNAIRILIDRKKIGYVTRAHLPAFRRWLREGWHIKGVVERKNGQPESPVLYLFIEVFKPG